MRKISGVLLALAASLALGATTVAAKDYGDGGGGGEKMQNEGKGGGGGERMRRHEEHGDMEHHHRRGHWRGGIWIYDDGNGGGGCYRWRHECADRWGWGGPGFRRCLGRHGC